MKKLVLTILVILIMALPLQALASDEGAPQDPSNGENNGEADGSSDGSAEGYSDGSDAGGNPEGAEGGSGESEGEGTGESVDEGNAGSEDGADVSNAGSAGTVSSPSATPAPKPAPQPPPLQKYKPADYNNVFVGDSRIAAILTIAQGEPCDTAFICQVGQGYSWLRSSEVTNLISSYARADKNLNLVIALGINDLENDERYASYLEEMAPRWRKMGYKLYFASINPVGEDHRFSNDDIDASNARIKLNTPSYFWVDTNMYLKDTGFSSNDGLHYDRETSSRIFDYLLFNID